MTKSLNYKVSEKLNNTSGVLMNLPQTALGLIPWLYNYQNSEQGRTPHNYGDWLIQKIESLIKTISAIIIAIWETIISIWNAIINYIQEVLIDQIQWLGYLLWFLIRAAILISAYIVFAISFLLLYIAFMVMIPVFIFLASITNCSMEISINSISLIKDTYSRTFKFTVDLMYIDFFDIEIPTIFLSFNYEYSTIEIPINLFMLFTMPSIENISNMSVYNPESSVVQSNSLKLGLKSSNDSEVSLNEGLSGMIFAVALIGLLSTVFGIIMGYTPYKRLTLMVSITALTLGITALITSKIKSNTGISPEWIFGIGIGTYLAMFIALIIYSIASKFSGDPEYLNMIFKIVSLAIGIRFILFNSYSLIISIFNLGPVDANASNELLGIKLTLAFISVIIGGIVNGINKNENMITIYCTFAFAFWLFFPLIANFC